MSTEPRPAPRSRRFPAWIAVVGALVLIASIAFGWGGRPAGSPAVGASTPPSAGSLDTPPSATTATPETPATTPAAVTVTATPTPAMGPVTVDGPWLVATQTGGVPQGRTLAVAVEKGLDIDPNVVARVAIATYNDKRGWASKGYRFRLVPRLEGADVVIHVTTPATTDRLCLPLRTGGRVSCTPTVHAIYLNSDRWRVGVPHFPDLEQYRRYLVTHEMGHALGFVHVRCPGAGRPAPVMLQQTLGLHGCRPNEWVAVG